MAAAEEEVERIEGFCSMMRCLVGWSEYSVGSRDASGPEAEAEANAEADLGRATGGEEAEGGADDALVVACRWEGSRLVRLDRVCAAAAAISSLAAKAGSEERSNGKACDDGDDGVG